MTRVRIRAVVFDLFITLTDFDVERSRHRMTEELASALGVDPTGFSSLMRTTFTERATGRLGDARATLAVLADRLGCRVSDEQLDRAATLRYAQQRYAVTPRAGVLAVMEQVRGAGYAVGVLTDCTAEVVDMWPSLPYAQVVDAVTFSCQVGKRKPHPGGYRDFMGKLGVTGAQCVYVGDGSSSELTGATALGMTAALLETPLSTDFRYDAEAQWAGLSIADLVELPALLRDLEA